jgi:hypothetical protein
MALMRVDFPALRSPVTRILEEVSRTLVLSVERWEMEEVSLRESNMERVLREREGRRDGRDGTEEEEGEVLRSMERMERGWEGELEAVRGVGLLVASTDENDLSWTKGSFLESFRPRVGLLGLVWSSLAASVFPGEVLERLRVAGEVEDWLIPN